MTKQEIIDNLELYTVGRPKKDQVSITVEELQNLIDEIKTLEQQSEDCVNRKAVLDCLTATGLKKFDFILDAREKVNNLPPAMPTQNWIPVSEGLPEEHEWLGTKRFKTTISDFVYVTFETPNGTKFTDYIRLQNGKPSISKQFELDAISKDIKLTAWMLPPKPYEGKQSNKVGWSNLENVREKVERGNSDDMG